MDHREYKKKYLGKGKKPETYTQRIERYMKLSKRDLAIMLATSDNVIQMITGISR